MSSGIQLSDARARPKDKSLHNGGQQSLNPYRLPTGTQRNQALYQEQTERLYETENDSLVDQLNEKVGILKGLAVDFNKEAKDQNAMLDDMVRGGARSSDLHTC
jgi:hypothetical protein